MSKILDREQAELIRIRIDSLLDHLNRTKGKASREKILKELANQEQQLRELE